LRHLHTLEDQFVDPQIQEKTHIATGESFVEVGYRSLARFAANRKNT
jgi:hypothetical protein